MKRWTIRTLLAPPVFLGDETKTLRANLLNSAVLTLLALGLCIMAGNLAGGKVPVAVIGVDIVVFAACLVLRRWAFQGRIGLAGGALLAIGLLAITVGVALLGTVRAPATAMYMLLVIAAGLVFDLGGMLVMIVLSSLAIAGLIVAENAGWLPRPDYAVTITQWVTFTALFAWAGSLTFSALQSMRQALAHADQEIAERVRTDSVRQRTEEQVRKAAREWQATFDATNDAIWILDQEQRVLRSNKTAERLFHRTSEELIGKHCWEIVHGTAQPIPECPNLRMRNSLRREAMELQIGEGWFEVVADPILDAAGDYAGAVHIVSDITERVRTEAVRRQVEEALRESEARYRLLAENVSDVVWMTDLELKPTYISPSIERLRGYTVEEAMNEAFEDTLTPESLEAARKLWAEGWAIESRDELRDAHRAWIVVLEYKRKDGSTVWAENRLNYLRDSKGLPLAIMGVTRDITKRKQVEEALRASEERYRTTMMSVGDGVIATDTQGRVELLNPVAEALTGWRQEQARGKLLEEVWRIINEETRQPVENPVRRVMREGLVVGLANHTVLIARDGTE